MLQIVLPGREFFDETTYTFVQTKTEVLKLEHSLVSLSKWESKWHKPFLGREPKTKEETIDYIKCMTITQNVDPDIYNYIPDSIAEKIEKYINESQTATTFTTPEGQAPSRRIITSELLYCWMFSLGVSIECEKWHLSRLMTLLKVCDEENKPKKKQNTRELKSRNAALNAARKQQYKTRG